ncbi:hypothetical protein NQ314_002873 [Rhamnusium bicolor]|uniref:Cytochrome c oxidase subunit n=1 Tax=Rhamnusium bicolor TaxID=1586634 RepID=A0AAV8ZQX3_9CUCU|nr:hypothetical protein NQ314_002873 [Rhamnusium bicolor]
MDVAKEFEEAGIKTIPPDARYHNCNATKWCFHTFVDYQKCIRLLGEESECCKEFSKIYRALCPLSWVNRWEEQIQIGTFPVDLPPKTNDCSNFKPK